MPSLQMRPRPSSVVKRISVQDRVRPRISDNRVAVLVERQADRREAFAAKKIVIDMSKGVDQRMFRSRTCRFVRAHPP